MTDSERAGDRRSRIIDAALDTIIDAGAAAATHRRIAERAGVPLGSLTYYFGSLGELHGAAFARLESSMSAQYRACVAEAPSREAAIEGVVDMICGGSYADARRMNAIFELYASGMRDAEHRELADRWIAASRESLLVWFTEPAARAIDALLEGLTIHRRFEGGDLDQAAVRASVSAIAAAHGA